MSMWIFFVALVAATSAIDYTKRQPNIIYILSDDLGHADVGFTAGKVKTPVLDRLNKEGVQLTQHYVQPICTPTRGALMSGRYPIHTGLQHSVLHPGEPHGLPLDETIIPQILKEYNYSTHIVGKWHLGMHKYSFTPARRGFDDFFGYYLGSQNYNSHMRGSGYDLRHDYWTEDGQFVSDVRYDMKGRYSAEMYAEYVKQLIDRVKSQENPFFLYMAFQNVHGPHMVPQRYIDQYTGHIRDKGERVLAAMVSAMDEAIGNITDSLRAAGLDENTVIVFSSDNGGDVNCVHEVTSSNFPYRGGKRAIYEGGVRSPSFIWAKGRLSPGKSNAMIHVTDWLPTFWNLASMQGKLKPNNPITTKALDGYDQWDTISRGKPSPRTEILLNIDPAPISCGHQVPNAGIRWNQWKLILGSGGPPDGWYPAPRMLDSDMTCFGGHKDSYIELYNIEDDPHEKRNVSHLYPHVVHHLTHKIRKYNETAVPPGNQAHDPASNPKYFNHTWTPWMKDDDVVVRPGVGVDLWDQCCEMSDGLSDGLCGEYTMPTKDTTLWDL